MFINSDNSGIIEVFRKYDRKPVFDQSTLLHCNVIVPKTHCLHYLSIIEQVYTCKGKAEYLPNN